MKTKSKTRYEKLNAKIGELQHALDELDRDRHKQQIALDKYIQRHRSLRYDGLATSDLQQLSNIYAYFDKRYEVDWEGGLRCDTRGMHLVFWIDKDPDFLIFFLTSTSDNICFGGSTSWRVKAATLKAKIAVITEVKRDIQKHLKKETKK